MTTIKNLTIWTIVLSFFTIVGAGHGIACVGLLEIAGLFHKFNIATEDLSFSLGASYDRSVSAVALLALIGHICLIISILTKKSKRALWTIVIGLIFLWGSFFYLTHNMFADGLSEVGFWTGLPFFIISIILGSKVARLQFPSG